MSRIVLATLFVLSTAASAAVPPHLELDLTSAEYAALLGDVRVDRPSELKEPLDSGKRFLDWLVVINKARDPKHQLSLSSPDTMPAFPIDSPRMLNVERIQAAYDALKAEMPEWLKDVLLDGGELVETPPVPDAEFVRWGLKVNAVYDNAARWTLLSPYLGALAARKSDDVRGYYHLTHEPDVEKHLEQWDDLASDVKERYRAWLVTLCTNGGTGESSCKEKLKASEAKQGSVLGFYKAKLPDGKKKWDSYFKITSKRSDVTWTPKHPELFSLPFVSPGKDDVKSFLVDNIEDEWRWSDWNLRLDFKEGGLGFSTAHIVFEAGATPHVSGLAGSTITMDANVPLTEYAVKWTIRHEFGHVIGFPDCYHEFYDRDEKAVISYQLDITNLMCSRRGKLQEMHYNELKRAYYEGDPG